MTDSGFSEERPTAELTEIVLPNDANILGNILGGKVMHLIDIACAIAAFRHLQPRPPGQLTPVQYPLGRPVPRKKPAGGKPAGLARC